MVVNRDLKVGIFLVFTLFVSGCAGISNGSKHGQPYLVVPHPGKYNLEYFKPLKAFPDYAFATVDGREFLATDNVQIPSAQSVYLLTHMKIFDGESVLDIGTGSGVQAVFAADNASKVIATDISAEAVDVARLNIRRNGLEKKIEVRQGDLFAPINKNEKFDVILFNIDYPYNKKTQGLWKVHERFFSEVKNYLNPGGRIYYESGLIRNIQPINGMVHRNKMRIVSIRMDAALKVDRFPVVYLIKLNKDLNI